MDEAEPWARWVFRVTVGVELLLALAQPVLAGGFLSGHYVMLDWHSTNGTVTALTAIAMSITGLLLWRPGGGPLWPALAGAGLFALEAVQIAIGHAHILAVHIPLGVVIIGCLALLATWSWRPIPEPAPIERCRS